MLKIPHKTKKGEKEKTSKERRFFFISGREKDQFLENLSMLANSGMNISEGLSSLKEELRSKGMQSVVHQMKEDIDGGSTLWRALERSGIFPAYALSLVRTGEESGRLITNLQIVAMQNDKERMFHAKLRSAMMYPLFVLGLVVIVGSLIAWFILPRLSSVFGQLGIPLPLLTRMMISAGEFLKGYGAFVVPFIIGGIVFCVYLFFFYSKTKHIGQTMLFYFPGVRGVIKEVELARFGFLLGTLLDAGLPVEKALESLERATVTAAYKRLYLHLRESIEQGDSFQKAFRTFPNIRKLMPPSTLQMIVAGERSGTLAQSLQTIGKRFEDKTEITTKNLSVIFEPILLVVVWLGVVAVALAVILPIYTLVGNLNEDSGSSLTTPPPTITAQKTKAEQEEKTTAQKAASAPLQLEKETSVQEMPLVQNPEVKTRYVQILETGAGFLNVREGQGIEFPIIERVTPGEVYEFYGASDGWYEIVLPDEETGFVSEQYVQEVDKE